MLDLSQERVLVTGGTGFLGRHLSARLALEEGNVLGVGRQHWDFTDPRSFANLLATHRTTVVIHLAAVCGGIGANQARPAEMIHDNLLMACNVVRSTAECPTVKKLVMAGTVCSYPKFCPTPFHESDLWNGYPEETNAPYGIAKRALFEMAAAYHRQYGLKVACLLPANLYGPGDSFDDAKSHVIPALIRKFVEARQVGAESVTLWGTGKASRDFLYVEDCADAIVRGRAARNPRPAQHRHQRGSQHRRTGRDDRPNRRLPRRTAVGHEQARRSTAALPRRFARKSLLNWEAATPLSEGFAPHDRLVCQ